MIIKQEITYYVQMEYSGGEWKAIGSMDMDYHRAYKALGALRKTFPDNNFRLVGKLVRHEVDEEWEYVNSETDILKEQELGYSNEVGEGLERHIRE